MTTITIRHNGFHGWTSLCLRVGGDAEPGRLVRLTDYQVRRLERAACDSSDCRCGESMLGACIDWTPGGPYYLRLPEDGSREIELRGLYPSGV